jgi:putative transposase
MSQGHNHLNHATWECKYHVVFTPKYRKKVLFGQIRRHLGTVFHELARRKECQIEEGHLMPDHVHILMSIPKVLGGRGDRISQGEKLDLGRAECGAQGTQLSRPQILGQGVFRFNGREGRGDDPRLHQESGDCRSTIGSAATQAQSRSRKSEQCDKWSFCLTASKISPRIRRDDEQETTPESHTRLQGQGGACRHQGAR